MELEGTLKATILNGLGRAGGLLVVTAIAEIAGERADGR
jgi:hypothetical protein